METVSKWELQRQTAGTLELTHCPVLRVAHAPPPTVASCTWALTRFSLMRCFVWNVCALLMLWVNKILHILSLTSSLIT